MKCLGVKSIVGCKYKFWVLLGQNISKVQKGAEGKEALGETGDYQTGGGLYEWKPIQPLSDKVDYGWVLWDRESWVTEAERMGLVAGRENKSYNRMLTTSLGHVKWEVFQRPPPWQKMACVTPIVAFDTSVNDVCVVKSSSKVYARCGPTFATQ